MIKFEDVAHISCKDYFSGEQFACDVFSNKYAHTKKDGKKETPAEVFYRVASILLKEKDDVELCFSLLYEGWFRPGGSVLNGVGSEVKISTMNCTTVGLKEDSLEAISKCDYDVMKCAAFRQGIGVDVSNLRPNNSPVNNAAKQSTGVIPWINKIVDNGKYVGQAGRVPALLISLKDNHPDVVEFITAKTEKGQIENANISVQISNKFMEAVRSDSDWELTFEFEKYPKISKIVKAKYIFDLIAETAYNTAEPGVQFVDMLRSGMMVHQIYEATGDYRFKGISSNACLPGFASVIGVLNDISIDSLKVGTDIWNGNTFVKVMSKTYKGKKEVFAYRTEVGTLFCTKDHVVSCKKKRVSAENATHIDSHYNTSYEILDVDSVGVHDVYDIEVDSEDHLFVSGGHVVSNCSEKFLPPNGVCNLASINMEMFDPIEYESQLEIVVPAMVKLSDAVIDYELENNLSPLPEQKWILEQTREIGCGITNIHGWLLKQGLPYDSDESIDKVASFWEKYASIVFKTSVELGKEKGSAPAYDMVQHSVFLNSIYYKNMSDKYYYGNPVTHLRNMAHMSIAPTGSLSNTFPKPCVSSGIEPITAPYYWRKTRIQDRNKYQYYFVIPNRVQEFIIDNLEKDSEDYRKMTEFSGSILDEDGSIGNSYIEIIERNLPKEFLKPSHEIDYNQKIKLMSKLYQWMDASISCTYNLPKTATVEDVKNIYMAAYEHNVRAVSVYVEGAREGILLNEFPKETSICAENRPVDICYNCAPKRPKELPCSIHQISVKGEKWVVLVGMFNNKPFEIFCGSLEDIYLPQKCQEGTIIKQGNGQYSLKVTIRNSDVIYKDIASVLMTDNEKALTRLLSLNLRHGVYIQFIVDQLKKSKGDITSFSTAISRVLGKYVVDYVMKDNVCPKCGNNSLSFVEGCIKCIECDYSRCE